MASDSNNFSIPMLTLGFLVDDTVRHQSSDLSERDENSEYSLNHTLMHNSEYPKCVSKHAILLSVSNMLEALWLDSRCLGLSPSWPRVRHS